MDKNAIKKYAIWARRELIDRVTKRAAFYGITADDSGNPNADTVNGHLLSGVEKRQRQALIRRIEEKGYEQVMEEAAYTWFNRFAALRFMEVNGYLPSHIRVFTDDEGRFKPQILAEAIHLELDGLNMETVYQLKDANQEEELFKYLLIVQCNALNSILPGMFQKIEDYTELLLPDYLLREGSVIEQMITLIPEDDWKDQVQIIGWLYQYYNTEPKDKVFADLKKNIKISKQNIPAATQLFTPDWIVHYMVENSLGRLWVEGHPSAREKYLPAHNEDGSVRVKEGKWNYYLEEAEQEPEVQAQLAEIRKQYAALKPEEILAIDPCAGSGHILCVLFDVLVNIYEDYGYTAREAAVSIVQNNLWGLDIDDRAAQLAYFAVMMKARQYDRRFFSKDVQPHVYAIQESNVINREHLNYLGRGLSDIERNNAVNQMSALLDEFIDAKEYGSILQPREYDWALLSRFIDDTTPMQQMTFGEAGLDATQAELRMMIAQGQALTQKYHAVVTNPPYMGSSGMGDKLASLVKAEYPDSKSDLFAVFMERIRVLLTQNGYQAMITQHAWMFLSVYEKLREMLCSITLINMAHLGAHAFEEIGGEVVQNTAFVYRNVAIEGYTSLFVRLLHGQTQDEKERMFLSKVQHYHASAKSFEAVPGKIPAYWLSKKTLNHFAGALLSSVAESREGVTSGSNDTFLRLWHEVSYSEIDWSCFSREQNIQSLQKWFPHNKGGEFRRWYGNREYIINWAHDGKEVQAIKDTQTGRIRSHNYNLQYNFREYLTWSNISSGLFSLRYSPAGSVFDTTSSALFAEHQYILYILGLLNSRVAQTYLSLLCPMLKFQPGNIIKVPFVFVQRNDIERIVTDQIQASKNDWDSFETSWDFQRHPLVTPAIDQHYLRLADCWRDWERACNERFAQLKANEEELNRIFIDIYGLQDELTPDVDDKDVTVRRADLGRDIRSLISYAVGCMFGRYSIDAPGLIFAGGQFKDYYEELKEPVGEFLDRTMTVEHDKVTLPVDIVTDYGLLRHNGERIKLRYYPDKDGILPITDDEYFRDDIVSMFELWLERVYGRKTLEENLIFIANALGGKGSPREVIREYFLNDFYKDHLKIYQKRPIYWLFDSGKKNGFKALIYMHRYEPDTIARIRTDYVHEMQSRYRTAIADVEQRINGASTSERVKLTKRLTALQDQAEELRLYEEKIHHLADKMIPIDLDDGVKVNYAKFADVLAPIK